MRQLLDFLLSDFKMSRGLLADQAIESNTDTEEILIIHWKCLQNNANIVALHSKYLQRMSHIARTLALH